VNLADYANPVFIAKVVDFVIFVLALVWLWNRFGVAQLAAQQEAQNKAVDDAASYREQAQRTLADAEAALGTAKTDARRMVEVGVAQASRLVDDERSEAEAHAKRILAHASGELERERYRVRRELLEETVERAHREAQKIIANELDAAKQRALVERLMSDLESTRA
jgi:F-type H+-transporting ATPase subunit b